MMTLEEWRAWVLGKLILISHGPNDRDQAIGICNGVTQDGYQESMYEILIDFTRADGDQETYWVSQRNAAESWHVDVYGEERR